MINFSAYHKLRRKKMAVRKSLVFLLLSTTLQTVYSDVEGIQTFS